MLSYLIPEILLTGLGIVLLLADALGNPRARRIGQGALGGLIVIALITAFVPGGRTELWHGLYIWDGTARLFKLFFLITAALVTWMSLEYERQIPDGRAEFYTLPLFTTAGMCLLASATDFTVLFVGLELVTISFYILVAYQRRRAAALEAGVKYLILGSLSSAFLILGIAYVFGTTGSMRFPEIYAATVIWGAPPLFYFGAVLVLAGLGFKMAVVPFHGWAPDVYQGAPTPITAFLSIGSKAAGFVLLIRTFLTGPFADAGDWGHYWEPAFVVMAGCSMVLGNFAAIPQRNIKRQLAYSGIGHAGFVLAGLTAFSVYAQGSALLYLATYVLASLLAFVVITIAGQALGNEGIHAYAGLSRRSPLLALALAVALISLAGIPPFVGFFGKLGIFMVLWESKFYGLFAVGVLSVVGGLYYYLSVVRTMYWSEPLDHEPIPVSVTSQVIMGVLIALLLVLGFWAQPLVSLVYALLKPGA